MRYRSAFNSGNAYRLADTAGECQQRKFPSERPLDAEAPALECQWDNLALRGPSGRVQRVRVTTRREAAGVTRAPRRSRRHAAGSPADRRNSGLLRPASHSTCRRVPNAYAFSARLSSLKCRQSVPSEMIYCRLDSMNPAWCNRCA